MSIADDVLATVRDRILSGELRAGSLHSIYGLAERFGVSRTPVREAMVRLADTGMISIEKNRGIRIVGLTVNDIAAVFEMRLLLEVPAAAFAAERRDEGLPAVLDEHLESMRRAMAEEDASTFIAADRRLHDEILAVSRNPRLRRAVDSLRDATQSMGASTIDRSRGMDEVEFEHQPIVDAIRMRDPAAAAAAMERHLVATGRLLMDQLVPGGSGPSAAGRDPWPDGGVAGRREGTAQPIR